MDVMDFIQQQITPLTNNVFLLPCVELRALATLLGPYGMKYLGDRMLQQIASQMGEIKVRRKRSQYKFQNSQIVLLSRIN